jgi:serine/threonine-protein kinase
MILSAGDIVADKYRIEYFIGEGGMGTVYAAVNQLTGRMVALKWLRTDLSTNEMFAERFMREARMSGRLEHPNIVNVFDAGRHRGVLFMVMELLRGEAFDVWVRRVKPSPADCIAKLMPALRAVAAAHAVGVVHRDLKPEHIFLCKAPDGSPLQTKVLDFGIAREVGASESTSSLTNPGLLIGTVHYMAPEQIRDSRRADARSDVYSLGVILYYAFGGGLPYEAESIAELILKVAEARPEPISRRNPKLPRKLVAVVMRAMSKDPERRYQTVAELGRALERLSGGALFEEPRSEGSLAPEASPVEDVPGPRQTTTMITAMGERTSVPARVASPTTLALIVLPAVVFLLVLAGSTYFGSKPGVHSGVSAVAEPAEPAVTPPPRTVVAPRAAETAPAPAANPRPATTPPPAKSLPTTGVATGRTSAPSSMRARPSKTAAPLAVAPSTALVAPVAVPASHPAVPLEEPATPIESNPYLRH